MENTLNSQKKKNGKTLSSYTENTFIVQMFII